MCTNYLNWVMIMDLNAIEKAELLNSSSNKQDVNMLSFEYSLIAPVKPVFIIVNTIVDITASKCLQNCSCSFHFFFDDVLLVGSDCEF